MKKTEKLLYKKDKKEKIEIQESFLTKWLKLLRQQTILQMA